MSSFPYDGTENNVHQTDLFVQLTLDRHFRRLTQLDSSTRRRPQRSIGQLESHQKHPILGVHHNGSNTFSQWQCHGHQAITPNERETADRLSPAISGCANHSRVMIRTLLVSNDRREPVHGSRRLVYEGR